ncbi:MAG: NUDIX domain-containing protein [Candidatus Binatia bacterium]
MTKTPVVTPIPSATVILLRDADGDLETLLLRRNSRLSFHGGAWVFPGGRIDPEDYDMNASDDMLAAARRAAVREAHEEAGQVVAPEDMIWLSHWTTPEGRPERYSTWFFLAAAEHDDVRIDGGEIHDHRWARPAHALAAQQAKELELPPPTFVTLTKLAAHRSMSEALSYFRACDAEIFVPRYTQVPGGICSMYQDDVGYPDVNVERPGRYHRLWMTESGWKYEKSV